MIKKKLTIWGGNIKSTPVYMLNPDLRKQCVVAVRQEDHYEFMEGHFEVWHNGGYSITNSIMCVNILSLLQRFIMNTWKFVCLTQTMKRIKKYYLNFLGSKIKNI